MAGFTGERPAAARVAAAPFSVTVIHMVRLWRGAAAIPLVVLGGLLLVFPTATSAVLAALALAMSLGLGSYALARRRTRRRTDA